MSNKFLNALAATSNLTHTENGAVALRSTNNAVLDFFYQAGAMRGQDILPLFKAAFEENYTLAIRVALHLRDCRGGAGERQLFRQILVWLDERSRDEFAARLLPIVPNLGRWDDLLVVQRHFKLVASLIHDSILEQYEKFGSSTAAKWMPRKGPDAIRLREAWDMTPRQYRKFLVKHTAVVETLMCQKEWKAIDYEGVPSLAMARYTNAFGRHDTARFNEYKSSLEKGEAKINAGALFPYDVMKTLFNGDVKIADAQWKALPDYVGEGSIFPMIDVSGSMGTPISGTKVTAMLAAISLGMYLAERNKSEFKDLFLTFSGDPSIEKIKGKSLAEKYHNLSRANWAMNTNIVGAFQALLKLAKDSNANVKDMPQIMLILSDMEFDSANVSGRYSSWSYSCSAGEFPTYDDSTHEALRREYEEAGYSMPKLVYWNLISRNQHAPVSFNQTGTALISGLSPAVVKGVLGSNLDNFTPEQIMLDTIMVPRYDF